MQRIATVKDTTLTVNYQDSPISTQIELDSYKFEFDQTWLGYTGKTAIFFSDKANVKHVLIPEDGVVTIPWETLVGKPQALFIGVFGSKGNTVKPTTLAPVRLREGSYIDGLTPRLPTPDVYTQIISAWEDAKANEVIRVANEIERKATDVTRRSTFDALVAEYAVLKTALQKEITDGTASVDALQVLETQYTQKALALETTYAPQLNLVKSQLAEIKTEFQVDIANTLKWVAHGGKKIVFIGDSITAGSPVVWRSYPQWFDITSNYGHVVINKGVYGHSSSQILARFDADVIANGPDYVVINAGKNDISNAWSLVDLENNLIAMVEKSIVAGIVPVITTILPYGNRLDGIMFFTAQNKADTITINDWIRAYAEQKNILLLDYYAELLNVVTGCTRDEYIDDDNLHPNRLGMERLALKAGRSFDSFDVPVASGGNLLSNSDFLLTTNGIPNDWDFVGGKTGGMTFTPTLTTNKYGGKTLKVVVDSTDTNTQYGFIERIVTGWTVGDVLDIEIDVMLADYFTAKTTPDDYFCARLRELNSGQIVNAIWMRDYSFNKIRQFRGRFIVPANATTMIFQFGFMFAKGTFYISRPNIHKVT